MYQAYARAVEYAVAEVLEQNPMAANEIQAIVLRDLPEGDRRTALLRLRFALGLSMCPNSRVLVDDAGKPLAASAVQASVLVS